MVTSARVTPARLRGGKERSSILPLVTAANAAKIYDACGSPIELSQINSTLKDSASSDDRPGDKTGWGTCAKVEIAEPYL